MRYGGNTPCAEIRGRSGESLILDAGTGIRELGRSLLDRSHGAPIQANILLSHAHWDHIQGVPFFGPLFMAGCRLTIWTMPALDGVVQHVLTEQMSSAVFPVPFGDVESDLAFRTMSERFSVAGVTVQTMAMRHPGGAVGYRITDNAPTSDGRALVYISDNEMGDAPAYPADPEWRDRLLAFVRGARVLVHDAMYTPQEYERHRGWGHSHDAEVLQLALEAGVERLVLFHHHPDRSEDDVDRRVAGCRSYITRLAVPLDVSAAAEGQTLAIDGDIAE